jgi:hypothetical protein
MIKFPIYKIKNNPNRLFLLKLVVFLVFISALDYSLGNIISYFYFKQQSGLQYLTTFSIEETKADGLIFGASKANHDYNPFLFEKKLNLSFYNVGRDGRPLFYHYAILKCILKRYSPKIIILDFNRDEFFKDPRSYDRIASLLPYYKNHPEIHSIIELIGPFEKYKLLSTLYQFNSVYVTLVAGNINKKIKEENDGYVPLTGKYNLSIHVDNSSNNYEIDSNKVRVYESFIRDCINLKIKLYIVSSPEFAVPGLADYSVLLAQEIAKKYNVAFFNYLEDSLFLKSPSLFSDYMHLNEDGSRVFSNALIQKIIMNK